MQTDKYKKPGIIMETNEETLAGKYLIMEKLLKEIHMAKNIVVRRCLLVRILELQKEIRLLNL